MFLTLEDPRARIKGSRDPLGVQPIWQAFGRKVVGNLTTQTDSCRGFAVLLLGRYLAQQLLEDEKIREEDTLDVFLRFEQVCGYARHSASQADEPEERLLGIERISRRSRQSEVTINATGEAAILSDQKAYGLWGLYSVAARASELLPAGATGVTRAAVEFIEAQYLPRLASVLDRLRALVRDGGRLRLKGKDSRIVEVVGRTLGGRLGPDEKRFFRENLCHAKHCMNTPSGLQTTFCDLLERHTDLRHGVNRQELTEIQKRAEGLHPELANRVGRILTVEALLAPCDVIFGLLRARHGQSPEQVADELHNAWGAGDLPHLDSNRFEDVLPRIADFAGREMEGHMRAVQQSLDCGNYESAIHRMLPWNEHVMANRGAAPWIRLDEQDGTLDVRYRGPEQRLPDRSELKSLWRYSYFINALKALLAQTSDAPAEAPR